MDERYAYIIKMVKDEVTQPRTTVFVDRELADEYFDRDVEYYRLKGWAVEDEKFECGTNILRRATMLRLVDGEYTACNLIMEIHEIVRR